MIKIRLTRGGRTHAPKYTIVAANSRSARDGKFIEKLGNYDPQRSPELFNLKVEVLKTWIEKGAQLSDTVKTLLKKNNVQL